MNFLSFNKAISECKDKKQFFLFEEKLLWYKDFRIIWKVWIWKKWNQEYFIDATFNKKSLNFLLKIWYKNLYFQNSTIKSFQDWIDLIKNDFKWKDLSKFDFLKEPKMSLENQIDEMEYQLDINKFNNIEQTDSFVLSQIKWDAFDKVKNFFGKASQDLRHNFKFANFIKDYFYKKENRWEPFLFTKIENKNNVKEFLELFPLIYKSNKVLFEQLIFLPLKNLFRDEWTLENIYLYPDFQNINLFEITEVSIEKFISFFIIFEIKTNWVIDSKFYFDRFNLVTNNINEFDLIWRNFKKVSYYDSPNSVENINDIFSNYSLQENEKLINKELEKIWFKSSSHKKYLTILNWKIFKEHIQEILLTFDKTKSYIEFNSNILNGIYYSDWTNKFILSNNKEELRFYNLKDLSYFVELFKNTMTNSTLVNDLIWRYWMDKAQISHNDFWKKVLILKIFKNPSYELQLYIKKDYIVWINLFSSTEKGAIYKYCLNININTMEEFDFLMKHIIK